MTALNSKRGLSPIGAGQIGKMSLLFGYRGRLFYPRPLWPDRQQVAENRGKRVSLNLSEKFLFFTQKAILRSHRNNTETGGCRLKLPNSDTVFLPIVFFIFPVTMDRLSANVDRNGADRQCNPEKKGHQADSGNNRTKPDTPGNNKSVQGANQ